MIAHTPALYDSEGNPYVNLFWDMIAQAKQSQASDIHIQPERDGVSIRFRVFGELSLWKWVPKTHQSSFLQEAKRLSQCSLAMSGYAQDSRIALPLMALDIRVNLIPSIYGEKLVLRLLDQARSFRLEQSGLEAQAIEAIQTALQRRSGVNLVTGPTGSGKTTLLYSALNYLDKEKLNIVTIEDPVEYTFPGITQVQVTSKLSFSDALRAMLRQDPDVILLGEVRDEVTADLCFQAASTGHLVLSTLHANSVKDIHRRLFSLGVGEDLIRSCVKFSSSQRLIPRLCRQCSLSVSEAALQSKVNVPDHIQLLRKRNLKGCPSCKLGIVGRIPLFEFMEPGADSGAEFSFSEPLKLSALRLAVQGEVDVHDAISAY